MHRSPSSHPTRFPSRGLAPWLRVCGCVLFLATTLSFAAPPAWWAERGVLIQGQNPDPERRSDYSLVNQGQLKKIATMAYQELEAKLDGGAGEAVTALIDSWSQINSEDVRVPKIKPSTQDDLAVNIGQLKKVAKPFYDRLIQVGYTSAYPWSESVADDQDYHYANIGQVKNIFKFDLGPGTPIGLMATAGNANVALSWNAVTGSTGYTLLRATNAAGPFNAINGSALTATTYLDAAVTNGVTYYYRVVALSATGQSVPSSIVAATPHDTVANDLDGDGYPDSYPGDQDGDGIPDADEIAAGTDPTKKDNPAVALRAFGFTNP